MKRREQEQQPIPREKSDEAHSGQKPQGGPSRAPEHGSDDQDQGRRELGRDG
jgi:hypothetical protein